MKRNTTEKRAKPDGSGRKAVNGEGTVVTTIRLTPEQQLHFAAIGGGAWLRDWLDQHIEHAKPSKCQ